MRKLAQILNKKRGVILGKVAEKQSITMSCFPQVVFATSGVGINYPFLRSLCEFVPQHCAQLFMARNFARSVVIPIIHTTNNKYYKGD